MQERVIALWLAIEKRYETKPEIAFELLNEVRDVDPEKWNTLSQRMLCAIRRQNPTRTVIIGSILLSAVLGILIYHEKLSVRTCAVFLLAVAAILLISL